MASSVGHPPSPSRRPGRAWLGWLASVPVGMLLPKCALCVLAWLAGLAGLGLQACGPSPSWMFVVSQLTLRFGRPAVLLAAVSPIPLALGAIAAWRVARSRAPHLEAD